MSASAAFLALRDVRLRLVARPTQAYGQQLMGALDPHRLADGDALRAWLERLPPLTSASEDGPWSALRDAEIEALERRDIPYFTMIASGGPVTACNGDEIDVPRVRGLR